MPKEEIHACQEKLAQVQQEYEDFVYLISHDLKAPIRAIYNLAEWVEEDLGSDIPAGARHNLHLLRDRSQRLDNMLAAILELSRVSRMNLELETLALTPFLQQQSEAYASNQVVFTIPEGLPTIITYGYKMQKVINQLFENAIKHNPGKNIHIAITYQPEDLFLKLTFSDNGSGIPAEQAGKIFNLFYTVQEKTSSKQVGAGLAIVKRIVDFVGGTIETKENSPAGSIFILRWPFKIIQKP